MKLCWSLSALQLEPSVVPAGKKTFRGEGSAEALLFPGTDLPWLSISTGPPNCKHRVEVYSWLTPLSVMYSPADTVTHISSSVQCVRMASPCSTIRSGSRENEIHLRYSLSRCFYPKRLTGQIHIFISMFAPGYWRPADEMGGLFISRFSES